MERAMADLRGGELERMFRDWASPALLQAAHTTVDAATGEVAEDITNYEVCVVALPFDSKATPRTFQQHQTLEQEFLLRSDQIPEGIALSSARLVIEGRSWSVTGITRSADG